MKIFKFVLTTVLSISILLYSVYPAAAVDTTLTVIGDGSDVEGSYWGGAGTWANMNSDDGDTSYWGNNGAYPGQKQSWAMSNTIPAHVAINSVTFYYKARYVGLAPDFIGYVEIAGVRRSGSSHTLTTTYTEYSSTWATNPATGVAWTDAQIYAADFGVNTVVSFGTTRAARVTYCYVVVAYTAPSAHAVTSSSASAIAPTSATMNGLVSDDGGATIDYYGFVWDTSDKGDGGNVDPSTPPGTWSNGWKSAVGDYGENTFDHSTGATLIKGTTYYYRAAAHNVTGWTYGSAVSFTTIGDPTISTLAATDVASTTARINSNVTFDGNVLTGEPCTVRFVYIAGSGYANYAAIVAGAETTVDVAGTWITGQSPYADITALAVSTTYSYAVRIVNSTATYAYGSVMTFTTESGVYTPTNFTAVPTASTVSLLWVKGVGAQYTLVKYSDATYPPTTADGISAYLGTGNSETLTGLTPGTTYYFSAWGLTAGVYSGTAITALATTLAYDTATSTGTIEAPPANSWWDQTPSTTNVGSIPMVSGLVQANATAYAIPESSLWYFLWSLFSVGMGIFVYGRGGNKLPLGLGATALMFSLGAVLGLVMLWIMVIFALIGAGFALWGDRR